MIFIFIQCFVIFKRQEMIDKLHTFLPSSRIKVHKKGGTGKTRQAWVTQIEKVELNKKELGLPWLL